MKCSFFVEGAPVTQGNHSKSRSGHIYEAAGKRLHSWRTAVAYSGIKARPENWPPLSRFQVYRLDVTFVLPRPKSLGKRPSRPEDAGKRPDASKLLRAVEDALTGVLYDDDSQIVDVRARKWVTEYGDLPGAEIEVEILMEEIAP